MSRQLPPLDMHAHVEPGLSQRDLEALGAVVFAATRSQDEFSRTIGREDQVTVWGVGCHPGVLAAQDDFDGLLFEEQLGSTPFVSEIGLDRRSKVPIATQRKTFKAILESAKKHPRILSVHSSGCTGAVLDLVAEVRPPGVVLHWWLGSVAETRRAVDLGCYFSINYAMVAKPLLNDIPLNRLLIETDHPAGDRQSPSPRRPGATHHVEAKLAQHYGLAEIEIRAAQWRNLARLVDQLDIDRLMPGAIQRMLNFARANYA